MATEANALLDLIGKATTFTQQIGSGWYKASAAMVAFPLKLTTVRQQSNMWSALLKRYGMSADEFIGPVLEQASRLLDEEEAKLKNLQSNCCLRVWQKLLFPDSVTASMDSIISAFEKLPQLMLEKEMITQQLEKAAGGQVARLPFVPDPKFVAFDSTIVEVRKALESETTGPVVTLCGGPGQGKTSMAKHLALLYQDASTVVNPPESGQDKMLSASKGFIDGVVFLSCGCEANSKDLLVELWQDLGYQLLPPTTEARQDQASSTGVQQSFISESFLRKELTRRLSSQKVLIVLDDVWESTLIEKVLLHGQWIKYLITSRDPRLWGDATCVQISITTPTSQEASQILRNHVCGFPAHAPKLIQDAIDAIVERSAHNPLVLANVATNISRGKASDPEEWRSTQRCLEDLIHDQDAKNSAVLFGRTYSKGTTRASTTMALNSFLNEEQTLLFLASICESQPIPEVVFKIFFKKIHVSLAKFPRYREHLESNNFIQIESKDVPWSSVPERSWLLHSMRQKFIGLVKENEVTSIFATLVECKTQKDIVVALLILYGQPKWRTKAAEAFGIPIYHFTNGTLDVRSLQLTPIKPFVSLLKLDGEEEWEEESDLLVEQIIQECLCSSELDDTSLSTLLAMEKTCLFTCEALVKMATLKATTIFPLEYPKTVHALLNLVESVHESTSTSPQDLAWVLLGEISLQWMGTAMEIGSIPFVLKRLVVLLAEDMIPYTQQRAARALGRLAYQGIDKKINFGLIPHAIERLVALLAKDMSLPTKLEAVGALLNISCGVVENRIKIASCSGAIKTLVALLGENDHPEIQGVAIGTLSIISFGVARNSRKIGSFPGAMERLVKFLDKDVTLQIQEYAAGALSNLCSVMENRNRLREAFQHAPHIVENVLDKASSEDDGSDLQYSAAKVYHLVYASNGGKMRSYRSSRAYLGQGDAKVDGGDYEGALQAYENGLAIDSEDPQLLSRRCFIKANLGDFEGALRDANEYMEVGGNKQLGLQERGILKQMAGDLRGALDDLNRALSLVKDDYESLKHRGFVKFLLSDENGARADAESALRNSSYGGFLKFALGERNAYLGTRSVEYLGYKLT